MYELIRWLLSILMALVFGSPTAQVAVKIQYQNGIGHSYVVEVEPGETAIFRTNNNTDYDVILGSETFNLQSGDEVCLPLDNMPQQFHSLAHADPQNPDYGCYGIDLLISR